mgnify:CR=1 FL=1
MSPSWLTVSVTILFAVTACAARADDPFERVTISSSPNPVGSGARAAGMGNAFVAIADDATAASWNPAGLVQLLRPEMSAVGLYSTHEEKRHSGAEPEFSGSDDWDGAELNFASVVLPFAAGERNIVFSISRQQLFSFDRSMQFGLDKSQHSGLSGPIISQSVTVSHEQDFEQEGSLSAVGFSGAMELTPRLALGFTINTWNDGIAGGNSWTKDESDTARAHIRTETISGVFERDILTRLDLHDERTLESGVNANMGLLWSVGERWTIGLSGKTPFTADIERDSETASTDLSTGIRTESASHTGEEMDFPGSVALGAAFRQSDFFSMSADVTRVEWGDFLLKNANGSVSPITGQSAGESDVPPTYAVRVGAEWLKPVGRTIIPLRIGAFYDPEPLAGECRDAWGVGGGTGLLLGDRAAFDVSYTYRWAEDTPVDGVTDGSLSDDRHLVMFSTIFYF